MNSTGLKKFIVLSVLFNLLFGFHSNCQKINNELPKEKQTRLELYVTSKEAYDKWKTAPDKIKVLDVRTPEEYIYIGHAPMACNIPLATHSHEWDSVKNKFSIYSRVH